MAQKNTVIMQGCDFGSKNAKKVHTYSICTQNPVNDLYKNFKVYCKIQIKIIKVRARKDLCFCYFIDYYDVTTHYCRIVNCVSLYLL